MAASRAMIYSPIGNRELMVLEYQIGLTGVNTTVQGRHQQFVYPIRMRQEPFQFLVQCRSQKEKEDIIQFIRKHQVRSIGSGTYHGQLRFVWPGQKIDFLGYIKAIRAGAVRFQYGPTLQLELLLVKDLVFKTSNVTSSGADWTGVYSGEVAIDPPKDPDLQPDPSAIPGIGIPGLIGVGTGGVEPN